MLIDTIRFVWVMHEKGVGVLWLNRKFHQRVMCEV